MVKVSEEAFEQVGSVVDNLLKAEFLARLKDLVKTSLKGQRLGVGNLKKLFNLPIISYELSYCSY